MPERSGRVQHYNWTLVPTGIIHFLPLGLVKGHNQVYLGCEEKGRCDPENNTSCTNRIDIGWRYPLLTESFRMWIASTNFNVVT